MGDGLSTLYQDLLSGSYDCVDRIVLNAYFRMGHDPGGFRMWWRQLTGSDTTLDNAHVMRLAGRFGRRIRGYAKANDIPVVNCSTGERSTTSQKTISPGPPSPRDCFSSWSAGPRRRCGMSAPITTSRKRSQCPMSTTIPFTFWTPSGDTSPSK